MQFAAFEKLRTPIWTCNLQSRQVVWANSAALKLWHVASLRDLNHLATHHPVPIPPNIDHYLEQFRQGQTVQELWPIYPIGQAPILIQCTCSSLLLENGQIVMLVEGHGEQAAVSDTEMLQAIVEHLPIMLACANAQGQLQFINRTLETVLGWSLAHWQQRDIWSECYPDPAQREQALIHLNSANGKWQDFLICTAQGLTLNTSWASIRLSDGRLIMIGQDISQRKQTEETLQQQAHRDRLMMQITQRISQSLELADIFDIAVAEMRQLLGAHRVFICQLDRERHPGSILAEAVVPPYRTFREVEACSLCYVSSQPHCCLMVPNVSLDDLVPKQCQWVPDVFQSDLPPTTIHALRRFSIRAFMSIPIFSRTNSGACWWRTTVRNPVSGRRRKSI
jgi:hypothetical protein